MKRAFIEELIHTKDAVRVLAVNPLCYLERLTVDLLYSTPVDRLYLRFVDINHMGRFVGSVEILSRDYNGIKAEIENAIRDKMTKVAEYLCNAVRNGYTI